MDTLLAGMVEKADRFAYCSQTDSKRKKNVFRSKGIKVEASLAPLIFHIQSYDSCRNLHGRDRRVRDTLVVCT